MTGKRTSNSPTPIVLTPATGWMLFAGVLLAVAVVGWAAQDALRMLVGGAALALYLSFPVRQLARIMPRRLAVPVAFLGLVGVGVLAVVSVLPALNAQFRDALQEIPRAVERIDDLTLRTLNQLDRSGLLPGEPEQISDSIRGRITRKVGGEVEDALQAAPRALSRSVGSLYQVLGTLFIAGYLLVDGDRVRAVLVRLAPRRYRQDMEDLVGQIGASLSRYLAGLLIAAVLQGTLAALGLWLLGVPNPLLLGVVTGIAACFPFVGVWFGALVAIVVAFAQSPQAAAGTLAIYFGISFLERYVIAHRIQGRALRIPSPFVFLAMAAGWQIGGLLGVAVALPVAAIVRELGSFLIARLRVASPDSADPTNGVVDGPARPGAPLVNLSMSLVVLPNNAADVRSASRLALSVGDATLSRQKNDLRLSADGATDG